MDETSLEIEFKLRYSSNGWTVIKLKSIYDENYYMIPSGSKTLSNYPRFFKDIVAEKTRGFKDKRTFKIVLKDVQLGLFRRGGQFVINDQICIDETTSRKTDKMIEKERMKKLKNLQKFKPETHDAGKFRDDFKEIFMNEDDKTLAKLELFSYIKKADDSFFRQKMDEGASLNEMLDLFFVKYQPVRDRTRNELENITLEQCHGNINSFIKKLFLFYETYQKKLTFKARLMHVISKLPNDLKQFFNPLFEEEESKESKALQKILNNEDRVIGYIKDKMKQNVVRVNEPVFNDLDNLMDLLDRPEI